MIIKNFGYLQTKEKICYFMTLQRIMKMLKTGMIKDISVILFFKKFAESEKINDKIQISFSKSTIDKCLEKNRVVLENHHTKHRLDQKHNLLAIHKCDKIEKEVINV